MKLKKLIAALLCAAMLMGAALAGTAAASGETSGESASAGSSLPKSLIDDLAAPPLRFWPGGRYDGLSIGTEGQKSVVEEEFREFAKRGFHTLEAEGGSVDQMLTLTKYGNEYGISVEFKGLMGSGDTAVGIDSMALETETLKSGAVFEGDVLLSASQEPTLEKVIAVQYEPSGDRKVQTDYQELDAAEFTLIKGEEIESGEDSASAESGGFNPFGGGGATDYEIQAVYQGEDLELGPNWEVILFYTCYDDDQGGLSKKDYYSQKSAQSMIDTFAGKFGLVYNETTGQYEPQDEAAQELYEELLINIRDFGSTVLVFDGGDANMMLTDDTWSCELVDKIEELFGYDFTEYMAVMYREEYTTGNDLFDQQIINDWQTAFSWLAVDCFGAIDSWAKEIWGVDTGFRACVGLSSSLDTSIITQAVTVPDTETYWPTGAQSIKNFDIPTAYTQVTSGSHLLRRQVTSHDELGAIDDDHREKMAEFLLEHANKAFYGGVNYMIYHVTPSKTGTQFGGAGYEDWGVTAPTSVQGEEFNGYIARVQYIMQNGTAQRDIALYQNVYDYTCEDYFAYETAPSIEEAGYSYDILTPAYMDLDNCYAEDGMIDPIGGRYHALVIDIPYTVSSTEKYTGGGMFGGVRNYPLFQKIGKYIPLETAQQFLEYAKSGVPIIVVGGYEDYYPEYTSRDTAGNLIDETAALHEIFDEIDTLGMLYIAEDEAEIVSALAAAGVQPDIRKDEASRIVGWKQNFSTTNEGVEGASEAVDADFYYLFNYQKTGSTNKENGTGFGEYMSGETVSQKIFLKGDGVPYQINLWTGEATRVANYERTEDGRIAIDVTLDAFDTTMFMIVGSGDDTLHASDLNADGYFYSIQDGTVYLNAAQPGVYTASLSDGSRQTVTVDAAAQPIDLTSANWTLEIESWSSGWGYTTTRSSAEDKVLREALNPVTVTDLATQTWNTLGTLTKADTGETVDARTVSGVGRYTTVFEINGAYDGAILSLGDVFDTVAVYVNGMECPVNMITLTVDISDALTQGENELTVEIGTNLMNVWYYATAGLDMVNGFGNALNTYDYEQAYGLYGPVTITPYVSVPVTGADSFSGEPSL